MRNWKGIGSLTILIREGYQPLPVMASGSADHVAQTFFFPTTSFTQALQRTAEISEPQQFPCLSLFVTQAMRPNWKAMCCGEKSPISVEVTWEAEEGSRIFCWQILCSHKFPEDSWTSRENLAMGYGLWAMALMPETDIQLTIVWYPSFRDFFALWEPGPSTKSASYADTIRDCCISFVSGIRMTASPIQTGPVGTNTFFGGTSTSCPDCIKLPPSKYTGFFAQKSSKRSIQIPSSERTELWMPWPSHSSMIHRWKRAVFHSKLFVVTRGSERKLPNRWLRTETDELGSS